LQRDLRYAVERFHSGFVPIAYLLRDLHHFTTPLVSD
jgi:hypothetical protein